MFGLGTFFGGLFNIWIVSRLLRATAFRRMNNFTRTVGPIAIALAIATVAGGFGFAEYDEPPRFLDAFLAYLAPAVVWLIIDVTRGRRAPVAKTGG